MKNTNIFSECILKKHVKNQKIFVNVNIHKILVIILILNLTLNILGNLQIMFRQNLLKIFVI